MELRSLRYFVEVVKQKSFTGAAEKMFVTQPTISKMVKSLEDEIGSPLLLRESRQMVLTDAGQIVYQRGLEVLAAHAQLEAELNDLAKLGAARLLSAFRRWADRCSRQLLPHSRSVIRRWN